MAESDQMNIVRLHRAKEIRWLATTVFTGIFAQVTAATTKAAKMPNRMRMRASVAVGESIALNNWQVTRGRVAAM